MWDDMQYLWNQFHTARGGFVADDCQPNSAFGRLSNQTCLATLIGVNSEDNELVKVLKALMAMQVCMHSLAILLAICGKIMLGLSSA